MNLHQMNIKMMLALACCALSANLSAQQSNAVTPNSDGYAYGSITAPTGQEWQQPQLLGYNKLAPHAAFTSFATTEQARGVLPENSTYWQNLDGDWKFHFAKNPDERPKDFYQTGYNDQSWDDVTVPMSWNIYGIQKDGTLKYGVPIYVNQRVIFQHRVAVGDWKGGVMREPPKNWTTYIYRNEVGSYRRSFDLPLSWKGREVYMGFDGVDSFFYLWVNGHYVGCSKDSRDLAEFDITPWAQPGKNEVAVEVYRNSDGSFLEAQDMFRLPGIFRTVAVYSKPKVHIQDFVVKPAYTDGTGTLDITTTLANADKKAAKGYSVAYKLYENKLYGDDNTLVEGDGSISEQQPLKAGETDILHSSLKWQGVKPWTTEAPHVYVLVAELRDKKGHVVEAVSTQTGFRTVEIRDVAAKDDEFGLAGRYFLINGKPLKLKGVNRHETNPAVGHAITRAQMLEEVMMMKRANINHVRTSHYSNDPYWYYLCNKYGIWLEAEANLESHEYYYGKESLSHVPEFRAQHVGRMMALAHARVNDPCIAIWSLGNEAGPGDNFKASYAAVKAFDSTRPVQYERNNDIVDMGSNQYPSVGWVQAAVKGKMGIKYPFHISEYAHSMGNAVGNLQDYWDAIESTNFFCGGAIWDWIDQSMYNYTKDGRRYLAYGGDFGDTPNDGQFVMNGIIFGDLEPKPQYYEVKKVYQNVGVKLNADGRSIDIFNKNYYTDDLSEYALTYSLQRDGIETAKGTLTLPAIAPRHHATIALPQEALNVDNNHENYITLSFRQKQDMPWAKAGYIQAEQQLRLGKPAETQPLPTVTATGKLQTAEKDSTLTVSGKDFTVTFDERQGGIASLTYGGKPVFAKDGGPRLDAFRAWVNNDNWAYQKWYRNGLHHLLHHATSATTHRMADGSLAVAFTVESRGASTATLEGSSLNWKKLTETGQRPDFAFNTNVVYTIHQDGTIECQSAITSNNYDLDIPRLGYVMKLPKEVGTMTYYGRGPIDNYPDRKTAQNISIWQNSVQKEFENFPKPQDMANHQDTRWVAMGTSASEARALFVAGGEPMSISALPWPAQDLAMANHPYELPASDGTWLHIDLGVTGLGGNSCGQGPPLDRDRVFAEPHTFSWMIRPATTMDRQQLVSLAQVTTGANMPVLISRDNRGEVTLEAQNGKAIYYQTTGMKQAKRYTAPFFMRDKGTVKAWTEGQQWMPANATFPRIEAIPLKVVFASSAESGEGDASHMVDGDADTYWHTMYSVTVASYPHWVDFDCSETKNIKGFSYLPRQDSRNGNIKDYEILVSQDGKTWKSVATGQFANNQQLKQVLLKQPVKARYVRFMAKSSQDGQDFASCAEFKVLEK